MHTPFLVLNRFYCPRQRGSIFTLTDHLSPLISPGVSKHLTVLVEGESLVNDGAAIVLFEVFQHLSIPDNTMTGKIWT